MSAPLLRLAKLEPLLQATEGSTGVTIGVIDGPVDSAHPAFAGASIRALDGGTAAACRNRESLACQHGTFVAGILSAARNGPCPGLVPGSPLLARPIFCEAADLGQCPIVTSEDLAAAVRQTVDAGARIVNLSLGLSQLRTGAHPVLHQELDRAAQRGVLVVGAAGNQAHVGQTALLDHPWVIMAVACDASGHPTGSNLGTNIGRRGLLAPGVGVTSTSPGGGYVTMSGTSVAAPFISGALALLWSLEPTAKAADIRRAALLPGAARRSIVPPLLDGAASLQALRAGA